MLQAFEAANSSPTTLAQSARLEALCRQFEEAARRYDAASSGAAWVLAAIEEAVESGSHFVAPRRIARICERWSAEGGPGVLSPLRAGAGEDEGLLSPLPTGEGEGDGHSFYIPSAVQIVAPEDALTLTLSLWERGEETPILSQGESEQDTSAVSHAKGGEDVPRPVAPTFPELGLPGRAVWQAVCDEALRRLTSPGDVALLAGSQLVGRETNLLIIGVPGRSAAQRAQVRLTRTLGDVTRAILGHSYEPRFVSLGDWSTSPGPPTDPGDDARLTNG